MGFVHPDKGEFLLAMRAIHKVAQINIVLVTVMIEKKNKLRMLFDVRDLRGYKKPATLYWNTEQVRQAKGDNETRALAVRVAKKQIKENITWTKEAGFRWVKESPKIEGQASLEEIVLEARAHDPGTSPKKGMSKVAAPQKEQKKENEPLTVVPVPATQEDPKPPEQKGGDNFFGDDFEEPLQPADDKPREKLFDSEEPLNKPVNENFFDDNNEFDEIKAEEVKKPEVKELPPQSPPVSPEVEKKAATKIQARVRGFLGKKHRPEDIKRVEMDYTGDPNDRYLLCAVRINGKDINVDGYSLRKNKNLKGLVVPAEGFSIFKVTVNAETDSLEYSFEDEASEGGNLDKPVEPFLEEAGSNKGNELNSSLVSRKSALFDGKAYSLSAHKYPQDKKIVLRLCEVGKKDPLDSEVMKVPDDVDIGQIDKLASSQLKSSRVGFGEAQKPKIFIDSDINLFAEAISEAAPEIIKPKGKALYTKQIDEDSRWQILPADETLKLYHFKKTDKDYNWTDFFCLGKPADTKLSPEQCEEILTHFVVDSEGIIECLDEEPSFKESAKPTPRPSKFGNNIPVLDPGNDKSLDIGLQGVGPDPENDPGQEGNGPFEPVDSDSEEGEGADFFVAMKEKKKKHEVLVERLVGDGVDIVEIVLIKVKDKSPVEIQEVVIPFDEDAEANFNEKRATEEKLRWEVLDEKPPRLRRTEPDPSRFE